MGETNVQPREIPRSGSKAKDGKEYFFLHTSSSYAKILGERNFHAREITRSGSKAKDGERKKKEDQKLVITMATSGGAP